MIIDPDFFDHWRTRMVVDALGGDEMAPMYIMRLWAHCQNRKGDKFTIPSVGIKALCKFQGDASAFEKALIDAEFLTRDGDTVTVEGWAERNASLIAAWENGVRGGRPKKPMGNQNETHGKPDGNPTVTHGKPTANPDETDKSREEKNSSSLRSEEKASAARKPVVVLKAEDLEADGISADHARDWLKARKVPLTLTAWAGIKREADKALISYGDVVRLMAEKGWRSFEADWVSKARGSPKPSTQNKYAGASAAIWEDEVTDV